MDQITQTSRICPECQNPLAGTRNSLSVYCSTRCKQAAERARFAQPGHGCRNKSDAGAMSELLVSADLLGRGYEVYRAVSPAASCDMVAICEAVVLRVQVKTAYRNRDGQVRCKMEGPHRCDVTAAVVLAEKSITYFPPLVTLTPAPR